MSKLTLKLFGLILFLFLSGCNANLSQFLSPSTTTPTFTSTVTPTPTKAITPTPMATEVVQFPSDGVVEFKILHLNDFHGELVEREAGELWIPGAARLSAFVKTERAKLGTNSTLLLDAGDFLEGSRVANPSLGEVVMDYYKKLGVDAAVIGNHEMFFGIARLTDVLNNAAPIKVLSVNYQKVNANEKCTTQHLSEPYAIFVLGEPDGSKVRVGVIGATALDAQGLMPMMGPEKRVCFPDPIKKVEAVYDKVKIDEKADVIIALTHLGFDDDIKMAEQLTTDGKPVDIIIGGHSHTWIEEPTKVGNTIIVTAGERGRAVGVLDLSYDRSTKKLDVKWREEIFKESSPQDTEIITFLNDLLPTLAPGQQLIETPMPQGDYLIDAEPVSVTVALNGFGKGVFPYSDADFIEGQVLVSQGLKYSSGLFTNAPSSVIYLLGGKYERFISDILVKDSTVCTEGAEFLVFLDDNKIYSSGSIMSSDPPQHLELEVTAGETLRLETTTAADGTCDWTIWGNPYLTPKTKPEPSNASTPMPLGDYLVNLSPLSESVGYWTLGIGVFLGQDTGFVPGQTLESHGITFSNGLFAHAPSSLTYELNGHYSKFITDASVKETACGDGAQFVVELDGKEIYHSKTVLPFDQPIQIALDVSGGDLMELVTTTGSNMDCDWTIWGDPYLVK